MSAPWSASFVRYLKARDVDPRFHQTFVERSRQFREAFPRVSELELSADDLERYIERLKKTGADDRRIHNAKHAGKAFLEFIEQVVRPQTKGVGPTRTTFDGLRVDLDEGPAKNPADPSQVTPPGGAPVPPIRAPAPGARRPSAPTSGVPEAVPDKGPGVDTEPRGVAPQPVHAVDPSSGNTAPAVFQRIASDTVFDGLRSPDTPTPPAAVAAVQQAYDATMRAVFSKTSAAIVVVLGLAGGGLWWWQRPAPPTTTKTEVKARVEDAAFRAEAKSMLTPEGITRDTDKPRRKGRIAIWDTDVGRIDPAHAELPDTLRASKPADVGTVVWIDWERALVGHYVDEGCKDLKTCRRVKAYATDAKATVMLWPERIVVDEKSFEGDLPEDNRAATMEAAYGPAPRGAIVRYLERLPE